jgi:membrane-bound lytic murein transglycosylase D
VKRAEDRFAAGRRAHQQGRLNDARAEFNRAIEILLTAPDNLPERVRVERRLDELVEAIYRYDIDQLGAGEPEDRVSYDQAPLDGILEMTFPVDPGLRSKVREQIQATVSQLPLEESDAVVGAINFFSTERGKKILSAGLRRAGRYKPMIERVLTAEGVPQELIFVAQAESGFLPRARSNKQCVGLWQFAKFRGKEYGLQQTLATDDRMDPEKATRAAARHLHDLYTHFGDWYLAMAAYNCGPGCVDHAVMRTGYADFWELRRLNVLPKETSNYVPVILAMTIMSKNAKDYGLDNLTLEPALEYDTLELQSPAHLGLIADAVERPVSELRELNPGLLKPVAPAGYSLHVPKGASDAVEAAFAVIPSNLRTSWRLHRVENG